MHLTFARAARRDLESIIDYIALDNPAAAETVFRAIMATAERLIHFPNLGHPGRMPDTRELTIPGLPYLIVYRVARETVTVLAVFHGARDLARAIAERRSHLSRQ